MIGNCVERLRPGDGSRLREARLRALRDAPEAFGATLEEVEARSLESWDHDVGEQNAPAIALYARKGFEPNGVSGTLPPPREHIREIQLVRRL